ncbi:MAG: hypothetical protein RLZZ74_730, partial [Cyanobacteriota bacterium]
MKTLCLQSIGTDFAANYIKSLI